MKSKCLSATPAAPPKLCDYEINRAEKIERNNSKLVSLGLMSKHEQKVSNLRARGILVMVEEEEERSESDDDYSDGDESFDDDESRRKRKLSKKGKKGKKVKSFKSLAAPTRISLRAQGLDPSGEICSLLQTAEEIGEEREERIIECREARLKAARAVGEEGYDKAANENQTATYEHCAMRVRTMTENALANRVKAIERAVGKHCIVKMAIFKSCLQDKSLWGLADLASESLERLKGLVDGDFEDA